MYRLLILLLPMFSYAEEAQEQKIADISVEDLTNIVRKLINVLLSER